MSRVVGIAFGCVILSLLIAASPLAAQTPGRSIRLDDLPRLKAVEDPRMSPDGKWVAHVVVTVDPDEDDRDSDLWMVSRDAKESIRLTSTPDSSESSPRWSPDNRYLAFLASRGNETQKKRGRQVWLLNRSGGEAQELTSVNGGVNDFAWSPDSKRLILEVDDPDPDDEPETKEGWKRKSTPPIVIDRYQFKRDGGGYLQRLHTHLAVFDVETRKAETLTSGPWDDEAPAWSPDGRFVAFVSNRSEDPDRNVDTNIYVIEAAPNAKPRQLTTFPGRDGGRPSWSPDGRWIAYLQGEVSKYRAYNLNKLAIVPAEGGEPRVLTEALDRPVAASVVWTPDSRCLQFIYSDDRVRYVAQVPAAGGDVQRLTTGQRVVSGLSQSADGSVALLSGTANASDEVYSLENGNLRRLTHHNDALFAELQLGTTEDFTSKSSDGTEVHGLVLKPASFVAGQKCPMLLMIHGGPASWQDVHDFNFDNQFFAANGYVVIGVNYRGSSARGAAYQKSIFADWGRKEVQDLLGAVDHMVAEGIADPDRLGIGGWSYGGMLTNYTIATDGRFKAAVSGAGSGLQLAMYGADEYIVQYDNELGPPWKSQDLWLRISYPFLHADRIRTPTLFLSGDKDFNVPVAGSEQMYQALKSQHIETQLVIYPGQKHHIRRPSYERDVLERHLAWFNKYLKPVAE